MRDSQRAAVYRWESEVRSIYRVKMFWPLDILDAKELVDRVWEDYEMMDWAICVPRVKWKSGRGRATASPSGRIIKLPDWAHRADTVLHETAHCMLFQHHLCQKSKERRAHGIMFARLVMELYEVYLGVPWTVMLLGVAQRPRRVQFAFKEELREMFIDPISDLSPVALMPYEPVHSASNAP